ncbi:MAG: glycosyltransferase family 39 protein, partial [Polyangiales bacterium]
MPKRFPDLDAELRATLEVPNGAPRVLRIASPNKVTLEPASASKRPGLAPGTHPLTVRWKDKTYAANDPHWDSPLPIGLTLEWSTDGKVFEPVPSSALRPTASNGGVRVWLWFGVALALGALGWLFFARRFRTDAPWHLARRIAVPAVLLLATCVRLYDYDVMPTFRDNDDELFATWNGWQLLTDGGTRGWTLWPQRYRRNEVRFELPSYFRERPFYVVQPYLEHPPLLHVLVGIAAKLSGAHHWLHAKLKYTRLVPIALSVLATWLVMLVAQRLSRDGPAPEFAGLLYAVLPPLVLQQRVIKEETLVTTLLLGAMWLFLRWRDDGRTPRLLVWLGIVCGLGALTKLPAGVLVPVFVALVWAESDWRAAGRVAISGLLVSALVLVYGAVVSWSVFTHATAIQATLRHAHWNVFFRFFAEPLVNHNRFGAGWIVFLWIALAGAWATYTERDRRLLAFTLIGYLVAIAIPSGNWHYGWYFLPLYPILVIGTGRFLANLYAE